MLAVYRVSQAEFIQTLERLDRIGKLPPSLREILTALRAITKEAA